MLEALDSAAGCVVDAVAFLAARAAAVVAAALLEAEGRPLFLAPLLDFDAFCCFEGEGGISWAIVVVDCV